MTKVWVVIDVGCYECGVDSEPVAIYSTEVDAESAADECNKRTGKWRDGGQTIARIFEMSMP